MKRKYWLKNDRENINSEAVKATWASCESSISHAANQIEQMFIDGEIKEEEYKAAVDTVEKIKELLKKVEAKDFDGDSVKHMALTVVMYLSALKKISSRTALTQLDMRIPDAQTNAYDSEEESGF